MIIIIMEVDLKRINIFILKSLPKKACSHNSVSQHCILLRASPRLVLPTVLY